MEENTEEEYYDDVFQLGCTYKKIEVSLSFLNPPIPEMLKNAKLNYFRLQAIASRLKIELPDQQHEEKAAPDERKQFFLDQLGYVDECIRRKSKNIQDMFCNGKSVEGYI